MNSEDNEYIKLKTIKTDKAAENLVTELDKDNHTFFLNGTWGAGKTNFLKNVERIESKVGRKRKFIYLDLWCVKDEKSVLDLAFWSLYPLLYPILIITGIISVIISILATDVINLGLEKYLPTWGIKITAIVALFVAVISFFNIKVDWIFNLLMKRISIFGLKKKILVIDDFDRISQDRQEEAYKLFNILSHQMTIIFVGDFQQIYRSNDRYLEKIIDRRIELPFVLQPANIWNDYFVEISKKLCCEPLDDLEEIAVYEKRNLRERKHFSDSVNREFFDKGKQGHVQVEQELLLIYVYLFHPDNYQQIIAGEIVNTDYELLNEKLLQLQTEDNHKYPQSFKQNMVGYLLFETVNNKSIEELEKVVRDEVTLKGEILETTIGEDFYQYFSSEYSGFNSTIKEKALKIAIGFTIVRKDSPLIRFIITEQNKIFKSENDSSISIADWVTKLGFNDSGEIKIRNDQSIESKCDVNYGIKYFSEMVYLLVRYTRYSPIIIKEYFDEVSIEKYDYKNLDIILLTFIFDDSFWESPEEWIKANWNLVGQLSSKTEQFLTFWSFVGILDNKKRTIYETSNSYIVNRKVMEPDVYNHTVDVGMIIDKIKPKLDELSKKGYQFNYKD